MFENSGAKIKVLAKVVFAVSVVGALVLAITFGRTYDRYDGTKFSFWKFLLLLLPSLLGSYVSALFIDAFGTLVMNSSALVAKSEAHAADGEMAMEDDGQGKERRKIQNVQAALKKLGYYSGSASGNVDIQTREAVMQFKKEVGMYETSGEITDSLINELRKKGANI